MSSDIDYYKILGVSEYADPSEIKKAFREKAKEFHPDANPNLSDEEKRKMEDMFSQVTKAYDILSNDTKRKEYDLSRPKKEPFYYHEPKHSNSTPKKEKPKTTFSKSNYFDMFNNPFYNFMNNANNWYNDTDNLNNEEDENFDEIIEIEKKIAELERKMSVLSVENEEILENIYKHNDERERLIKKLDQSIQNIPDYINAKKYIAKMYAKDQNFATRIFITNKQYDKLNQYRDYVNKVNQEVKEKKDIIYETSEAQIKRLEEQINKNFDERLDLQNKRNELQGAYNRHPLRAKYELHKMTESREHANPTKNSNNK